MKLKNPKAKGNRREYDARDCLIYEGYDVVKAGGSLGVFDLVAVAKEKGREIPVIMVQVKSNYIGPQEVQEIADHCTSGQKEIWIKKDYKRDWIIIIMEETDEKSE